MSDRAKVAEWLDKRIHKGPVEMDLFHHRGDKVESLSIEENEGIEEVIARIFDRAGEDAKGMTGPQGYWIVLRVEGTKDVLGRKSITVDGEVYEKGRGSESPDEWGLTSQAMRHTEGILKTCLNGIERAYQNVQRENERMTSQLTELSRSEIERMTLHRELARDTANQRVEEQKIIAQSKREEWFANQLELLLPVAASKLFGEGDSGPKWDQETSILLALVSVCSPELLGRVLLVFPPAARVLIGALGKGDLSRAFAPLAVERIMSSLSEDGYVQIYSMLETKEQREIFSELHQVRKHGIEWAAKMEAQPTYQALPPPEANGTLDGTATVSPTAPIPPTG